MTKDEELIEEVWNKLKKELEIYKIIPANDFIFKGIIEQALSKSTKQIEELKEVEKSYKRQHNLQAEDYNNVELVIQGKNNKIKELKSQLQKQRDEWEKLVIEVINWYDNKGRSKGEWLDRIEQLKH